MTTVRMDELSPAQRRLIEAILRARKAAQARAAA